MGFEPTRDGVSNANTNGPGALVVARVNNGSAEGITHFGVRAGQRVIQANAEGYVIRDGEVLA